MKLSIKSNEKLEKFYLRNLDKETVAITLDKEALIPYGWYELIVPYIGKKIEISDLDKKRILSSIEKQMQMKGYTISNNPDLIINVNTKSREDVYINRYNDYPYYGWYPYGMSTTYRPSSRIIGLLYIDVIDAKTGSLLWQGNGSGTLSSNRATRDELINNFVSKLLESYPELVLQ